MNAFQLLCLTTLVGCGAALPVAAPQVDQSALRVSQRSSESSNNDEESGSFVRSGFKADSKDYQSLSLDNDEFSGV